MHLHILGICGTFMGSLAQLARAAGHRVTGSDANVYPPMSTQLESAGIELIEGFDPSQLSFPGGSSPDLVIIGNALSRGNPCVEEVLNRGLPYASGPQWLGDHVLRDRWVLAVAGTHGKTTTSAMLAWILEYAGMSPGYLIGGVPGNFPASARLGSSPFFIVEADEYDTAFFDKRSKFLHYHGRTVILNNLEFDHADIFPDLAAIETQFHHLVRTIPAQGLIVAPAEDANIRVVLDRGCWTPVETVGGDGWRAELAIDDGSSFSVFLGGRRLGDIAWRQTGRHNVSNALAAIAAARHAGVRPEIACAALAEFAGVKRRMELIGNVGGIEVYDDFAHHPTAIATTLDGLRKRVGEGTIIAVLEPRSNTMKLGAHGERLFAATGLADRTFWFQPGDMGWSLRDGLARANSSDVVIDSIDELVAATVAAARRAPGPVHIVVMSNGGFMGFHGKLVDALRTVEEAGDERL